MSKKSKKPPSPKIKARIIKLGKDGLGNEKIAALVPSVNPNQVAGILFRAKVERAKKRLVPKSKKKELQPKASNVVRLPRKVSPEHKIPADDSAAEPHTPAEQPPGTSPALKRISALQSPLGGKGSPFPETKEKTKNPDDLTEEEIRAIERAFYGDKK